jgi:hypothetical protein
MSSMPMRASHVPEAAWALPNLNRLTTLVSAVLDVFTDAQDMARAAYKRYPFMEE